LGVVGVVLIMRGGILQSRVGCMGVDALFFYVVSEWHQPGRNAGSVGMNLLFRAVWQQSRGQTNTKRGLLQLLFAIFLLPISQCPRRRVAGQAEKLQ